jgi:hypothetical protein
MDTKHSKTSIFENILYIRTDIRNFQSLPVFAERLSTVQLSVVADNAELNLALSSQLRVFGSFRAFSAKKQSQSSRFRRKCGVRLIVVGENAE